MILFCKRIFPVRFSENSALAAVIFKPSIVRGKQIVSSAVEIDVVANLSAKTK